MGIQSLCPAKAVSIIPESINLSAAMLSTGSTLNALEYFGDIQSTSIFDVQGSYNANGFFNTVTGIAGNKALSYTIHGTTTEYDMGNKYITDIAGSGSFGSGSIATSAQLEFIYNPLINNYSGSFSEIGSKNPLWLWIAIIIALTPSVLGNGEIEQVPPTPPSKPPRENIPISISPTNSTYVFGQASSNNIAMNNGLISGQITVTPVPGPLPFLGLGVALAWSRKIRRVHNRLN